MDGRGDGALRRFRLLFVCTGNLCRSPFARFHTRALLEMRLGPRWASWFDVASGGTGAVVGAEMHPLSRAQLGPLATHPDVAAFRARQLPARDVELADLVLTVSRSHRSAVLELEPRALRSTFTMREFARLLEGMDAADRAALPPDPRERAHALVAAALAERGQGAPVDPEDDAIADPVQGTVEDHAEVARRIHAAVRPLVDAIGAAVPWPGRRPVPPRRPAPQAPPGRPSATGHPAAPGAPGPSGPSGWVGPPGRHSLPVGAPVPPLRPGAAPAGPAPAGSSPGMVPPPGRALAGSPPPGSGRPVPSETPRSGSGPSGSPQWEGPPSGSPQSGGRQPEGPPSGTASPASAPPLGRPLPPAPGPPPGSAPVPPDGRSQPPGPRHLAAEDAGNGTAAAPDEPVADGPVPAEHRFRGADDQGDDQRYEEEYEAPVLPHSVPRAGR